MLILKQNQVVNINSNCTHYGNVCQLLKIVKYLILSLDFMVV